MTDQIFTVRNRAGEFIGTYRASNATAAISRFIAAQAEYTAVFRTQGLKRLEPKDYTASIEPNPWAHPVRSARTCSN